MTFTIAGVGGLTGIGGFTAGVGGLTGIGGLTTVVGALTGALVVALIGALVVALIGALVAALIGALEVTLVGAFVTARARIESSFAMTTLERKSAEIVAINRNFKKIFMVLAEVSEWSEEIIIFDRNL